MIDINIGAITETLNYKTDIDLGNIDVNSGADVVIKFQRPTAENGYTWYRKYVSGWVEQGGSVLNATSRETTIALPIVFSNPNYNVNATSRENGYWGNGDFYVNIVSRSNSSITASSRVKNFDWEAKGMAA